jgi:hypothetical protein
MAVVTFDLAKFRDMYPEFSNVTDTQLEFLFDESTDYLDNTDYSLVIDGTKRERLLYLLMAHLAYLRYGYLKNGQLIGGTGMVGRISSASEGSVSVGTELGSMAIGTAWYTQSPYGLAYWQATKVYRMANYYPGGDYYFARRYP